MAPGAPPHQTTAAFVFPRGRLSTQSVTSVNNTAFYGRSSSPSPPRSPPSATTPSFQLCSSLVSVEIPTSVTTIGDAAFNGCSYLVLAEIPTSVAIGYDTFAYCSCNLSCTSPVPPSATAPHPPRGPPHRSSSLPALVPAPAATWRRAASPASRDRGLGICCELEVHNCVCEGQGAPRRPT